MKMQSLSEKNFAFLEQSPYFYEKREPFIAETGGVQTAIVYTFYSQENPYQEIAEIVIPLKDIHKEIKWKFYHLVENEKQNVLIYQTTNPKDFEMPVWFNNLIRQTKEMYRRIVGLLRIFNPEIKNSSLN
jgi:hypothetical protein